MEGDIRGFRYLNSVRKIEKLLSSAWKKEKSMYTILIGCLSISDARQPEVDFLHSWAVILNKFLGKLFLRQ